MAKQPEVPFNEAIKKDTVNWKNNPLTDEVPDEFMKDGRIPNFEGAADMRRKNDPNSTNPVERYRVGHYSEYITYDDGVRVKHENDFLFLVQIEEDDVNNPDMILDYVARPEPPFGGGLSPMERNLTNIQIKKDGITLAIVNNKLQIQ